MEHIRQPPKSYICGQCCIAMVAGVPLAESVKVVGHKNCTGTKTLRRALSHFGVETAPKLQRVTPKTQFPKLAIVSCCWRRGRRPKHWMVYSEGRLLDPSADESGSPKPMIITSFLEIKHVRPTSPAVESGV